MNPFALIQLVSEQTMQNLLPILALKPRRVIQIRSKREDMAGSAANLINAVKAATASPFYRDLNPEFQERVIHEPSPTTEATRREMEAALAAERECIVNLTGGTKLMSFGARDAARERNAPTLYCDTQAHRFIVEPAPGMTPPDFARVVQTLSVEIVLAAHGLSPEKLLARVPTTEERAFGKAVAVLWNRAEKELEDYLKTLRKLIYPDGKHLRTSRVMEVFSAALPAPTTAAVREFLNHAATLGVLRRENEKFFWARNPGDRRKSERVDELRNSFRMLESGWYELAVYERMAGSGQYMDLRLDVQSRVQAQQYFGETDIIGIDLKRFALTFVSCKLTDGHLHPLDHVFATRQRSLEFGGSHAGTIFYVRRFLDTQKHHSMQQACQAIRATLYVDFPPPLPR